MQILSVRSAHAAYQARVEEEKLEQQRKKDEVKSKKEEDDKKQKEKEKLQQTKKTLLQNGEDLAHKELAARAELDAAEELLNDAMNKLHGSLTGATRAFNKQSVNVATMMLDAAKRKIGW